MTTQTNQPAEPIPYPPIKRFEDWWESEGFDGEKVRASEIDRWTLANRAFEAGRSLTPEDEVEKALAELREMFPDIEHASYNILARQLEIHLPDEWIRYFKGTFSEAMAAVRAWKKRVKQNE